jgi:hypothetical protein
MLVRRSMPLCFACAVPIALFSIALFGCGEEMISSSPDTTTRMTADSTYLSGLIEGLEWRTLDSASSMIYTSFNSMHFRSEDRRNTNDTLRTFAISISDLMRTGTAFIQPDDGSISVSYGSADSERIRFYRAISGFLSITSFDTIPGGRIEGTLSGKMVSNFKDTIELKDVQQRRSFQNRLLYHPECRMPGPPTDRPDPHLQRFIPILANTVRIHHPRS